MTKRARESDVYAGRDPLLLPTYTVPDAAHLLGLSQATLRSWILGRYYPVRGRGRRFFDPLVEIADPEGKRLSFQNLVELYVLSALRRSHGVKMREIRSAIDFLLERLGSQHPLAEQQMLTDGTDLLVERYGELINVSRDGQLEMKELVRRHLSRVERDPSGLPVRLYPFTSSRLEDDDRTVVVDPRIQFGRPCVAHSGIPTAVLAERWRAGDSIAEIAEDYGQPPETVEEAIRFEQKRAA